MVYIETRGEVCEKLEIAWKHSHEMRFYNSIGTRKKCFLFPLRNSLLKAKKDKCIEFNNIYSNINLNLDHGVKSNYRIEPVLATNCSCTKYFFLTFWRL